MNSLIQTCFYLNPVTVHPQIFKEGVDIWKNFWGGSPRFEALEGGLPTLDRPYAHVWCLAGTSKEKQSNCCLNTTLLYSWSGFHSFAKLWCLVEKQGYCINRVLKIWLTPIVLLLKMIYMLPNDGNIWIFWKTFSLVCYKTT